MTTTQDAARTADKQAYRPHIERALAGNGPAWARRVREDGAQRFERLEFPHRRMEAWRFTNVSPILRTAFAPVFEPPVHGLSRDALAPWSFSQHDWPELVLVDGYVSPGLSTLGQLPAGVRLMSLAEALDAGFDVIEPHLDRYAGSNGDIFNAMNSALFQDGAVVHVRAGVQVEVPLHVLHVSTEAQPDRAANVRLLIVAERESRVSLVESYVSAAGAAQYLNNVVLEAHLAPAAQVDRFKVLAEGEMGYHLSRSAFHLKRDTVLNSYTMSLGGKIGRNALDIALDGENAECTANGLYLAETDQLIDNPVSIEHVKPHCRSWIGYKGVLGGRSHGVYSGRVYVHRNAQKTDSNQLNQNLLLSDQATVNTKPLLEIFADDVKCTHGATTGQPPKELIFYFQTRGINPAWAHAMLTCGFADEVVEQIGPEPLRSRLRKHVFDKYSPGHE